MPFNITPVTAIKSVNLSLAEWEADILSQEDSAGTLKQFYQQVAWLYKATQLRAQAVSSVPWSVQTANGDDYVPDPRLASRMPDLLWRIEGGLTLFGSAYLLPVENALGEALWYRWVSPQTITINTNNDTGQLESFTRRMVGATETYEPAPDGRMVYIWAPSLYTELGPGSPPAAAAHRPASQIWAMDEYVNRFFANGAIGTSLLFVDPATSDEERNRLERWWRSLVGGLRRAHEAAAIKADSFKYERLNADMDSLAAPELTEIARQNVSAALGVPDSMMRGSAANYATAVSDRKQFYQDVVTSELRLIEGALNEQIFEPLGVTFAFQEQELEIFQEEESAKAQSFAQYVAAGMPPGVAADMLGLDLPNGMTGDELTVLSMAWRGDTAALPPVDTVRHVHASDYSDEIDTWQRYARKHGQIKAANDFVAHTVPADTSDEIRLNLLLADSDEEVRAAFHGPFLGEASVKANRTTAGGLTDPNAAAKDRAEARLRRNIRLELERQAEELAQSLRRHIGEPDAEYWARAQEEMFRVLRPELQTGVEESLESGARELGLTMDWDVVQVEALEWARQYGYGLVRDINTTTRTALQRAISGYIETPTTIGDLTDSLKPVFGDSRAQRIAVTEVTRAFSEGTQILQEQADVYGFKMVSIWHTNKDELVCDLCRPLDNQPVGEVGYPPRHPNCRCWSTLRREND